MKFELTHGIPPELEPLAEAIEKRGPRTRLPEPHLRPPHRQTGAGARVVKIMGLHRPAKIGKKVWHHGEGRSAAAIDMRFADGSGVPFRRVISGTRLFSTTHEALAASAFGAIEECPEDEELLILTRNPVVANIMNGRNRAHANLKWWKRFWALVAKKRIRVRAEYIPKDDRTFRELRRIARDACEQ